MHHFFLYTGPLPGYCYERRCIDTFREVCGTDGLLYKNQCDVGEKSCGTDNDHLDVLQGSIRNCVDGMLILIYCLLDDSA